MQKQTNNTWLDKFCAELGYHNLTFLTTRCQDIANAVDCTEWDVVDGFIGVDGFKIIKAIVTVLMSHIVNTKLKDLCHGCEIDHPSQMQHSCLFEPTAYFFEVYFKELSSKLFRPQFKKTLVHALTTCGLRPHPQRIQGVVEAILCELRYEPFIV
ncbi:MAG: hypothetical protein ACRC6N_06515, partial [Plesiomonas sp.]|uniref:hypothetical protein n=1 Tax=Plesiomonas sp. TaxID=2486279 RepID=UPI003F3ECC4A